MRPSAAPEAAPGRVRWAAPVAANLALGFVFVVPLLLTLLFLVNYPLAWLGLTQREPTENDGPGVWVFALALVWTFFGLLWWLVNLGVGRLTGLRGRRYWWVVAGLPLLPSLVMSPLSNGPWTVLTWLP
ncbi:hypothetical protein [Kitasatospora sp. NPDC097643]|uniref:hypothetical protein n=1 Tax=Kitasatospora sp. NPDC097643 TaxID=3157230 RepID=UPI00331E6FD2